MRAILLSTLALGTLTTTAIAAEPVMSPLATSGPVMLTDAEMDSMVAGKSAGYGIDNAYDVVSNGKAAISSQDGAPYSIGNIGFQSPEDTDKPRGTGNVYPGWGTYAAPGQQ
jgi:hypothetical protein